ncbi:MAG: NAD(P)H-dependent oxidoreductase subunit E [Candidatus Eisenbacteria bacterium]|uniref:NAD(P)H-dependent oxidoreductase subunit E n=1 Tax=Eiseniibacteriota bacterium TaxID=2212470 RepID=A0A937X7K7_UNCEI|nr:NAD(P)H-dependent oxidoreductase subunit E [Candidatus Eisenbacteria bacterium]
MNAESLITINGRPLAFTPGETILEVARRNGIFIPTLCHLAGATPTGACRICVVEVAGARSLMASCTVPAAAKMVVHTQTPRVLDARRTILELLLAAGNHNCSARAEEADRWTDLQERTEAYDGSPELCEVYGACKLQALAYRYQVRTGRLAGRLTAYPLEEASALILRDFSRCILCGRCVQACNEVQVNRAISHGFRGAQAKIIAMGDASLDRSECVFCGECVQACPVGALVEKRSRYRARPWDVSRLRSTCGYCGVGCRLELQVKNGRIVKIDGLAGEAPNDGRLCLRGRFGFDYLNSPERLAAPQVRRDGKLAETTWDDALDLVAGRIREVQAAHGADAVAGVCSAGLTSESLYAFQRLVRGAVGTNNLTAPFASPPATHSLARLERLPAILLIGSDLTREHPVAGTFVRRAVLAGGSLIVIDSRDTAIAGDATVRLRVREGTEAVLLQGLIRRLLETGGRAAAMDRAELAEMHAAVEAFPIDRVAEATGADPEAIGRAVEILDREHPAAVVYGPRVGAWAPEIFRLQRLLGNLAGGAGGVYPLGDLANSQGAELLGLHPAYLPGYVPVSDAEARAALARAWGVPLSDKPGMIFPEILASAASKGETRVRLLLCAGENLAVAQRVLEGSPRAVESAEFLVQFDTLGGEMLAHADVVLPLAAWGEEEGTFVSAERRVSLARRALDPPGEARPAAWVFTELARRLGADWPHEEPRATWETQIARQVPQVAGITYARLAGEGLQWPVPTSAHEGSAQLEPGEIPPAIKPQWQPFNDHHRRHLERCQGLLEAAAEGRAAREAAVGARDPEAIRREMEAFLRAEEALDKRAVLDEILERYRPRRGGLIPVLQLFQEKLGFLPVPVQNYIALGLGLPAADVYGVVSFYAFFTMTPRGRHTIRVCLGTACYVKEAGKIIENIAEHLGVKVGETTPDRLFTLTGVRCVGACGLAPVVVVGEDTHGMIDPAKAAAVIEAYRSK